MARLDILIPVKDRYTVVDCVSQILVQMQQVPGCTLGKILICEGGSHTTDCQAQIRQVSQLPSVKVLACPHPGFNKGWLLNQGIAAATADLVLISDVDILWHGATLQRITHAATHQPHSLYTIQSVQESQPTAIPSPRPRYTYRIQTTPTGHCVEILPASASSEARPGCGLLCGQRRLFQMLGGYRHGFQGWGWEDQDLLIRAHLLGYSVCELGHVIHLSHGDDQRNLNNDPTSPEHSRDRNIMTCLSGLTHQQLRGDLPTGCDRTIEEPRFHPGLITVRYPATLTYAAHPDHPLSQSS